ncbi:unnamed protein product [Durusdinium trenchii]|uniref:Uncharacterized protein n=1 Tax=Durusdinium trenchii TaxID=1381693 RepID=A0ABP0K7J0_9DINO
MPTAQEIFGPLCPDDQVITYDRLRHEPAAFCPSGHKVILSRIPWQAGCRHCYGVNGRPAGVIAQFYDEVLSCQVPCGAQLTSQNPEFTAAQYKGKTGWLQQQKNQQRGKGPDAQPAAQPAAPLRLQMLLQELVLLLRPCLSTQSFGTHLSVRKCSAG